jgi:hypothetical protein
MLDAIGLRGDGHTATRCSAVLGLYPLRPLFSGSTIKRPLEFPDLLSS